MLCPCRPGSAATRAPCVLALHSPITSRQRVVTVSGALGRHLALAGFMGAGKTTFGEEVARRLRRRFVDLDQEIERQTGATIEELFARDGESGFRAIEERIAAAELATGEPAVIALGGGTVLSAATREAPSGSSRFA